VKGNFLVVGGYSPSLRSGIGSEGRGFILVSPAGDPRCALLVIEPSAITARDRAGRYISFTMIAFTDRLAAFERRYQQEAYASRTYADNLASFTALWQQAQRLNPDLGADWLDDLESDRAIARALNGIPDPA